MSNTETGDSRLAMKPCVTTTVPFARYVVMHRNDLSVKRCQVQPVWRPTDAKRPLQEFQFDADVIGSNSLLNETELLLIIADVFSRLGLKSLN
jgi:histidyl-tRNA synthetase